MSHGNIIDYDAENDSLFLRCGGTKYESSLDIKNIILDFGVDDALIGVEILDASKAFNVSKKTIQNAKNFRIEASIREKKMDLKFFIRDSIDNDKSEKSFVLCNLDNNIELSPMMIVINLDV